MIRVCILLAAALVSAPLAAQDHSGHNAHGAHAKSEVDHCAMGHMPADQCPPKNDEAAAEEVDDAAMGHSGSAKAETPPMDHSAMGHGTPEAQETSPMDHAAMGHGTPEAQDATPMDHAAMGHGSHSAPADKTAKGAAPETAVPPRALEGPRHAADSIWGTKAMAPSREQLARENGDMKTGMVLVERLEARFAANGGETGYVWDAQGWYGGDINRLVIKTEGEGEFGGELEDAEIQALYSRAIGPFFDLQAGVRFDPAPNTRTHLVVGVQGLAPYMFHVDGALFLSDRGNLTARIEVEYDQKITQQLILQPRIEIELAAQDISDRDIGAGITKIEPGVRLRYELKPEFAPYIGIEYEAKIGATADLARLAGEDPNGVKVIAGLRIWF